MNDTYNLISRQESNSTPFLLVNTVLSEFLSRSNLLKLAISSLPPVLLHIFVFILLLREFQQISKDFIVVYRPSIVELTNGIWLFRAWWQNTGNRRHFLNLETIYQVLRGLSH